MAIEQVKTGSTGFHWNVGGWFGSIIGGSCWMLIFGVVAAWDGRAFWWWPVLSFILIQAAAWVLWRRRDRLAVYPCLQLMIGGMGLLGLSAFLLVDWRGLDLGGATGAQVWLALLVYPAMMILFHLKEAQSRRDS